MQGLTIGKVAGQAGVGVETVRFYERSGLIDQPPRTGAGYRKYPEETVRRIRFIRHAKELGFSLKEIGELLDLQNDPAATCGDIQKRAEAKLDDIGRRIKELEKMRDVLAGLVESCSHNKPIGECPILSVVEENRTRKEQKR